MSIPVVLTIAGSDSGGGAGIQADLKTFEALGVFGTSAITCVTAQNPQKVTAIEPVSPDLVSAQIKAVADEFPVAAVKTGMLYSSNTITAVAETIGAYEFEHLVVDPVMAATSGAKLLEDDAIEALKKKLLPTASVITPNLHETQVLCGAIPTTLDEMKDAARTISALFHTACVVKGGHALDNDPGKAADVLCSDGKVTVFDSKRIEGPDMHGTGCTFSSALAAFLAKGELMEDSVKKAKDFVTGSLKRENRGRS